MQMKILMATALMMTSTWSEVSVTGSAELYTKCNQLCED
jgi:hypothetical protein